MHTLKRAEKPLMPSVELFFWVNPHLTASVKLGVVPINYSFLLTEHVAVLAENVKVILLS